MYQDVVAGSYQEKVRAYVSAAREVIQSEYSCYFIWKASVTGNKISRMFHFY